MNGAKFDTYEIFLTQNDDRVCPICSPHHGKIYKKGEGAQPPLHFGCRCKRVYHHAVTRTPINTPNHNHP